MRTGVSITVSPADRSRLVALVKDRNTPQKHFWRKKFVSLRRSDRRFISVSAKDFEVTVRNFVGAGFNIPAQLP
jgi:hypothetical protein